LAERFGEFRRDLSDFAASSTPDESDSPFTYCPSILVFVGFEAEKLRLIVESRASVERLTCI
jgi:hypothetical protein